MFSQLSQYLRIFLVLQTAGLSKDLSLRFNFLLTLIGSLCFFYLHLVSFSLIIDRFQFPGWQEGELWVLLFTFQIFTYLCFYLLWRGLSHTPRDIRSGGFDAILTKPVSSRFLALFRNGSTHNSLSALLGVFYLIHTLTRYQINTSIIQIILYILTLLGSLWIFHCFSLLFITLNFRYGYIPESSATAFELQEVFKYPATLFTRSSILLQLLVVPFALLTTLPTVLLLAKPVSPNLYIIYVLTFILLSFLSHRFWHSSLHHYSSASS